MLNQFSRTELLIGKEGMEKLKNSRVAVFGIGGVGGYTVEALVRSGVGTLDLIDDDKVCLTNINRQIYATRKTVGKYKVDVARERILEINLDRSHYQKVKALNVTLKDRILYLVVDSARDVSLELGLLKDKKEFFEEVFGIRLVMRRKGRR